MSTRTLRMGAFALGLAVTGCFTGTGEEQDGHTRQRSSTAADAGSEAPTTQAATLDSTPVDGGTAHAATNSLCKGLSKDACGACCNMAFPQMVTAVKTSMMSCICADPGECATECGANACKGATPSSACSTCVQNSKVCAPAVENLCQNTPECAAYAACLSTCQ